MHTIKFEFDTKKAQSNQRKHGVDFEQAAMCLLDPMALVREDSTADGEPRFVLLGRSQQLHVLVVIYTMRDDITRLISARRATKNEVKIYED